MAGPVGHVHLTIIPVCLGGGAAFGLGGGFLFFAGGGFLCFGGGGSGGGGSASPASVRDSEQNINFMTSAHGGPPSDHTASVKYGHVLLCQPMVVPLAITQHL